MRYGANFLTTLRYHCVILMYQISQWMGSILSCSAGARFKPLPICIILSDIFVPFMSLCKCLNRPSLQSSYHLMLCNWHNWKSTCVYSDLFAPHPEFEMPYFWNIIDCVTGCTSSGAWLDIEFETFNLYRHCHWHCHQSAVEMLQFISVVWHYIVKSIAMLSCTLNKRNFSRSIILSSHFSI